MKKINKKLRFITKGALMHIIKSQNIFYFEQCLSLDIIFISTVIVKNILKFIIKNTVVVIEINQLFYKLYKFLNSK